MESVSRKTRLADIEKFKYFNNAFYTSPHNSRQELIWFIKKQFSSQVQQDLLEETLLNFYNLIISSSLQLTGISICYHKKRFTISFMIMI